MVVELTPINYTGFRPYILTECYRELFRFPLLALGFVEDSMPHKKMACGAIAARWTEPETVTICSFMVDEKVRRLGIGSILMAALMEECRRHRVMRVEMEYVIGEGERSAMEGFCRVHRFSRPVLKADIARIVLGDIKDNAVFLKIADRISQQDFHICRIDEVRKESADAFLDRKGTPGYLDWREMKLYAPLSLVLMRDDDIHGCMLVSRKEGDLMLEGVGFKEGMGSLAGYLLWEGAQRASEEFAEDTTIVMSLINEHSRSLFRHLAGNGGMEILYQYKTERWLFGV